MSEFLSFRKMITPVIIQAIFWVGVVICFIGGLFAIIVGVMYRQTGLAVFVGLSFMFIGPILTRIYCEILILFFRMNETLSDIRKNTMLEKAPE